MIKTEREARIAAIVDQIGIVSIHDLAQRLGGVPEVTVRRDVARLADRGAVRRYHGGATRIDRAPRSSMPSTDIDPLIEDTDAIVLPPLEGQGAETLRLMARRRAVPFLAESAPQTGGIYLGPDNFAAGRDLGAFAAAQRAGRAETAKILVISLEALPNTRARSDGFLKGFSDAADGPCQHWRVDGHGMYHHALRASLDALQAHPDIDLLFGVNDHSILAAIEASDRLGLESIRAFSVGGEGSALFDALTAGHKLVACGALFPDVVGARAVDVLAAALAGDDMPQEVRTPHTVLTSSNLREFYHHSDSGWVFAPSSAAPPFEIDGPPPKSAERRSAVLKKKIGFVPHYPAHDWYRNLQKAMQRRAERLGLALVVAAPQAGIAREVSSLRRVIAAAAAATIQEGDTVAINHGEASMALAEALGTVTDLTVVTNSLEVLELLGRRGHPKVILTSGEIHAKERCLVGPSLGALFETLRVDKAFLSVDGVSARFGLSASDERMALAARRLADASREVHVLADHSLIGRDANHRIIGLEKVDTLMTDSGSLPADRFAFASAGIAVTLADEETATPDEMTLSEERPRFRPGGPLDNQPRPRVT